MDPIAQRVARRFQASGRLYYHVTTSAVAAIIMKTGFRADKPRTGWDMGRGVYLTPHLNLVDQKWMSHLTDRATLEVSAPTNLLKIKTNWPLQVYQGLYGYEEGNAAFDEATRQRLLRGKSALDIWNDILQPLIKKAGFEGCMDTGREDNVIIFDPARVKPLRILP